MEQELTRVLDKLEKIDANVTALDKKLDVQFAALPVHFVTRLEYNDAKHKLDINRRWTVGTVISVVGLILTQLHRIF